MLFNWKKKNSKNKFIGYEKYEKKDVLSVVIVSALYNIFSVVFSFVLMNIVDSITANNYKTFKISIIWALIAISLQIIFFAIYNIVKGKITQR